MSEPNWWAGERMRRQWPLEDLLAATAMGRTDLQLRLNVSGDEWTRAASEGLTDRQADRWSVKVKLHPGIVWDGWLEAGMHPLDELHVCGSDTSLPGWRQAYEWAVSPSTNTRSGSRMGAENKRPRGALATLPPGPRRRLERRL